MPPGAELVYFDASIFIAWFNDEPGRSDTIEEILTASFEGRLRVITSVVSLTEVAYFRTEPSGLDQNQLDQRINALLLNDRLIGLIPFDQRIALRARQLVRVRSGGRRGLTVLDAIHLASAELADSDFFATYDRDFAQASDEVTMRIGEPTREISG